MVFRNTLKLAAGMLAFSLLAGCLPDNRSALERVIASGELRVIMRNSATTYYEGPAGPTGFEYDLAKGFADELGVELKVIKAESIGDSLARLSRGQAHFAAAGLAITEDRKRRLQFTPTYQLARKQLIYRLGSPRPKSLAEVSGWIEVPANSGQAEFLQRVAREMPFLRWTENGQGDTEELLTLVAEKVIDYAVLDSHEVSLLQRYYPDLRAAFDLGEPMPVGWAFRKGPDDTLYRAASAYIQRARADGRVAELKERYYGHVGDFDYVGTRYFMRHVRLRLPNYRELFEQAALENRIDWRLLAAVAYQESHWNPDAVSPTGVRGLMMLTQATARQLGIKERTDPVQSIEGGARYLRWLLDRVPERIGEPDRTWLALAAYNIGYGHMEDARRLTLKRGGNPDLWGDVKETLPLLHKRAWHSQTRYGYARGREALTYVENIRTYYDMLVWHTDQERTPPARPASGLRIASPIL